jgi:hypothetical protein
MVAHMMAMAIAVQPVPVMPAREGVGSGEDPLTTYRRAYRVVVALTPSRRDPDLAVQRRIFAALGAAAAERDLVLATYDDATPEGATLRRRFGGTGFRAILVGKDGEEKISSGRPFDADALLPPRRRADAWPGDASDAVSPSIRRREPPGPRPWTGRA